MKPMVEKVARAIAFTRDAEWEAYSPELKETYRVMARAAIAAMREPTPWMCDYVKSILLSCGYGHEAEDFELIWGYMAEAALAEGDGK